MHVHSRQCAIFINERQTDAADRRKVNACAAGTHGVVEVFFSQVTCRQHHRHHHHHTNISSEVAQGTVARERSLAATLRHFGQTKFVIFSLSYFRFYRALTSSEHRRHTAGNRRQLRGEFLSLVCINLDIATIHLWCAIKYTHINPNHSPALCFTY